MMLTPSQSKELAKPRSSSTTPRSKMVPKNTEPLKTVMRPNTQYRKASTDRQRRPPPSVVTPSHDQTMIGSLQACEDAEEEKIIGPLARQVYYHGLLPRDDIQLLLQKDGDFMLRRTEHEGKPVVVLSCLWQSEYKHIIIRRTAHNNFWVLPHRDNAFHTVVDLVDWFQKRNEPVSTNGAKLLEAIPRQRWQIPHANILLGKRIGGGAFGDVFRAMLRMHGDRTRMVAVKQLKSSGKTSKEERSAFVKEARFMRSFQHPNVVQMIGIAATRDPIMIVMELAEGGSLQEHLKTSGAKEPVHEHVRYCLDAAKGLNYLEQKRCIHRDVAARNCLFGANNQIQINDFGLSAKGKIVHEKELKHVPVKWLAPETLERSIYSSKTDVWSFGVLVWEVFANGLTPYPGMTNADMSTKVVLQGYRMCAPNGTPPVVAKIMVQCWAQNPNKRPDFATIEASLAAEHSDLKPQTKVK